MKKITEEMGVHKEWYKEARNIKLKDLPEFIEKLTKEYEHDYGTIVHAISAAAIAGAYSIEHSKVGGITGFQAGAVKWEFLKNWDTSLRNKPLRMINYQDMLYPQYDYRFNTISESTWKWVQEQAEKELEKIEKRNENLVSPSVKEHWESIVEGNIPFELQLEGENNNE